MTSRKGDRGAHSPASKYDLETHKKIVAYLRRGSFRSAACNAARIGMSTLRDWMQRGDAGEEPYATFAADVREAEAHVHNEVASGLFDAGKTDYKAYVEYGKVRFPDDFFIQEQVNIKVQAELSLVLPRLLAYYGPEKADEIAAVLAGTVGEGAPALPPANRSSS